MKQIPILSFEQKKQRLQIFKPNSETWVVSDLQSKWQIQTLLLDQERVLEEEAVLRASEFWARLLSRLNPNWSLVSRELFDQWLWSWMKKNPLPWLKANESASLLHRHVELFAPLFLEETSESLVEEWFENNPDSVIRWKHLYQICKAIWQAVQEDKILSPLLVPAVLLNELKEAQLNKEDFALIWSRPLHFDLGLQPRSVEKSIVQILSEILEVHWLENQLTETTCVFEGELKRLPTQLGEAKEVVAQVRKQLDQGVKPQDIAILAPDIENFWPTLSYLFRVEGVPCNKALVQRLMDDPHIQKWMSQLRVAMDQFTRRDLESYFFQNQEDVSLSFEKFRHYFEKLKKTKEVSRWPNWQAPQNLSSDSVNLTDFFAWALQHWSEAVSGDSIERVWKILSQDFYPHVKMPMADWVFYLESKVTRSEVQVEEAHSKGVQLLSLFSAEWSEASNVFFIGLNEAELSSPPQYAVSRFECEKLKQDLGFDLNMSAQASQELYLRWISKKPFKNKTYLTSAVTFTGEEVSPSKYWLQSAYLQNPSKVREVHSPEVTRFDEKERILPKQELEFTPTPMPEASLSATTIRSFKECPFVFFAQKGLKLEDQPVLDFDLDPLNKGRLVHAILEEVVMHLPRFIKSEADLESLIEDKKKELNIQLGELRVWPAVRKEIFQILKNFIQMEVELRESCPDLKPIGSEVDFGFYVDLETMELKPSQTTVDELKISGRIDRVDVDSQGRLAIVDYKLSSSQVKGWTRWVPEAQLQMPIYSLALENSLTNHSPLNELSDPQVQAAYYVIPKTKERHKGFFKKMENPTLFVPPSSRSHSWITEEKQKQLLHDSMSVIKEVGDKVRQGEFAPEPENIEICKICRWRNLCRAPHLI